MGRRPKLGGACRLGGRKLVLSTAHQGQTAAARRVIESGPLKALTIVGLGPAGWLLVLALGESTVGAEGLASLLVVTAFVQVVSGLIRGGVDHRIVVSSGCVGAFRYRVVVLLWLRRAATGTIVALVVGTWGPLGRFLDGGPLIFAVGAAVAFSGAFLVGERLKGLGWMLLGQTVQQPVGSWVWVVALGFGALSGGADLLDSTVVAGGVGAGLAFGAAGVFLVIVERAGRPSDAGPNRVGGAVGRRSGVWLTAMSLSGQLQAPLVVIVLSWTLPLHEVGLFASSARLAGVAALAIAVTNSVAVRLIGGGLGSKEVLLNDVTRVSRWLIFVTCSGVIVIAAIQSALGFPFGSVETSVLITLVAGIYMNGWAGPAGYVLILAGMSRLAGWLSVTSTVLLLVALVVAPPASAFVAAIVVSTVQLLYFGCLRLLAIRVSAES